jgi:hypothetical protein
MGGTDGAQKYPMGGIEEERKDGKEELRQDWWKREWLIVRFPRTKQV